jgi:hypothetical protein
MTARTAETSSRTYATLAGFAYLLPLAIVIFANYSVHERLIVLGNAAETARNILASEPLFRIGIVCDLIYSAGLIVLLTILYRMLKDVNHTLALLAASMRLIYAVLWVLMALHLFDVLRLLSGADYLNVFDADRLQALMRLTLNARFDAYYVGLVFYGLASTVCSYLWLKSRYIPRALAVYGIIASVWCAICAFAFFMSPGFAKIVDLLWFDAPIGIFEIAMGFWLLFRGLNLSGITKSDIARDRAEASAA